jgi:hypothetical protein
VKYEQGFYSQKTPFFIVTAVKTSNLTDTFVVNTYNPNEAMASESRH